MLKVQGFVYRGKSQYVAIMWEQSLLAKQAPRFQKRPHRLHRGQALLPQLGLPGHINPYLPRML
ncbi:hypothetical protein DZG01_03000 [Pseudomonas fluorescens]|nr:hypothetical protein DZG01_03000 [Pseudomonas fluorescens]